MRTITTIKEFEEVFGLQTKEEYIAVLKADIEMFQSLGDSEAVAVLQAELNNQLTSN